MPLTFSKPAALHGDALTSELAAAGFPDAAVSVNGRDELEVAGVTDADRDGVQAVIDGHVPPDPEPTKDDKLAAIRPKVEALPQNNPARAIFLDLIDAV